MSSAAPARDLPVLFFQAGDARHLPYTFWQAQHWAGGSPLILLGDESNRHYRGRGLEHVPIRDFASAVPRLRDLYVHISSNTAEFEFFCLARWLVMEEFARRQGLHEFLYLDCDILLYEKPSIMVRELPLCRMTLASAGSSGDPMAQACISPSVVRDPTILEEFSQLLFSFYSDPRKLEETKKHFEFAIRQKMSAVSDMWFFGGLMARRPSDFYSTWTPPREGLLDFDINQSAGFRISGGMKDILFRDGVPYGFYEPTARWIRFGCLHFGGHAKKHIRKYLGRRPDQNLFWARFRERLGKGLKWHKPDPLLMEVVL